MNTRSSTFQQITFCYKTDTFWMCFIKFSFYSHLYTHTACTNIIMGHMHTNYSATFSNTSQICHRYGKCAILNELLLYQYCVKEPVTPIITVNLTQYRAECLSYTFSNSSCCSPVETGRLNGT
jgi:hypothetical protein